jgi:hypothetical protein
VETPVAVAVAVTGTLGTAEPLASVTVPKMTLVAVWANAPELSAISKTPIERKQDTVDTSVTV